MRRYILVLVLYGCCDIASFGQDSLKALKANPYFVSYPDKFFIWPVLKQRQLSFELSDPGNPSSVLRFRPNNSVGMGVGVYVFDLGIELVMAVPVDEKKNDLYGTTKASDLQLNILSKRWGADVFYQRYQGFYLSNPDIPLPLSGAYPQRPDVKTQNLGVSGVYIFNHGKFSLRSSYTFADRQLRSAGSFIVSGAFNSFSLTADSALLNSHYAQKISLVQPFQSVDYQTLSLAPGYSYNFVIKKFFINGTLALGPAVQWLQYNDLSFVEHRTTTVNTFVDTRFSVGYSNDRFFTGVTLVTQARNVVFQDIHFGNNSSTYRILFGWRFKESGILKKSVWSLLPAFLRDPNGK
ncbi:MAG: DUF4421 family protein [Bacteroidetes bacterium]|nr:DUF4421 family protein [Bacteroidota bacterium]